MFHQLTPEDTETSKFVLSARTLQEVEDRTGKGPEELADWVGDLEQRARELEQRCQELGPLGQQIAELRKERDGLVETKASLDAAMKEEKRRLETEAMSIRDRMHWMRGEVKRLEQQFGELGKRFLERVGSVQEAEDRLATAQGPLSKVSNLGIRPERWPDIAQRLKALAVRHHLEKNEFLEEFLNFLEGYSTVLGLESVIKANNEEICRLHDVRQKLLTETVELAEDVKGLRQRKARLAASLRQMEGEVLELLQDMRKQSASILCEARERT